MLDAPDIVLRSKLFRHNPSDPTRFIPLLLPALSVYFSIHFYSTMDKTIQDQVKRFQLLSALPKFHKNSQITENKLHAWKFLEIQECLP